MTLTVVKPRVLVGKLLVVTGIALLILWLGYFLQLVRPVDIWDFCLLPAAFAAILYRGDTRSTPSTRRTRAHARCRFMQA